MVTRALVGNAKANPHAVRKVAPLRVDDLTAGIKRALALNSYDGLLWAAMAAVAFLSCARAQELTDYDHNDYKNTRKTMLRESARRGRLLRAPPLPQGRPALHGRKGLVAAADAGDLFLLVRAYLAARDTVYGAAGPLWLDSAGVYPTRQWFVERVKARCGEQYSGHSFRAGGATWYALQGANDAVIKRLGQVAITQRQRDAGSAGGEVPGPPSLSAATLRLIRPLL
ncbi:hypothetical protein JCM3770_006258 [Rhodotorula araucariae]